VDLNRITWVLSGDEHVAEYQPPANVVPIAKGKKMEDMLITGEIPEAIGVQVAGDVAVTILLALDRQPLVDHLAEVPVVGWLDHPNEATGSGLGEHRLAQRAVAELPFGLLLRHQSEGGRPRAAGLFHDRVDRLIRRSSALGFRISPVI
jgi:hypothetical protein